MPILHPLPLAVLVSSTRATSVLPIEVCLRSFPASLQPESQSSGHLCFDFTSRRFPLFSATQIFPLLSTAFCSLSRRPTESFQDLFDFVVPEPHQLVYSRASSATGLSTYRISHSPRPLQPSPSSSLQGQRASCRPLDVDYTRSCLVSKFRCPPLLSLSSLKTSTKFFFPGRIQHASSWSTFLSLPLHHCFWIVKSRF